MMVRQGKGKKDRTLWIGEADLKLLKKWLKYQAKLPANAFLFTTYQEFAPGSESPGACSNHLHSDLYPHRR